MEAYGSGRLYNVEYETDYKIKTFYLTHNTVL